MSPNRIEEVRKKNNMTVSEIINKLGISRTTFYNYETDAKPVPSDILLQLSKMFNVSTDYLLNNDISLKQIESILMLIEETLLDLKRDIINLLKEKNDKAY